MHTDASQLCADVSWGSLLTAGLWAGCGDPRQLVPGAATAASPCPGGSERGTPAPRGLHPELTAGKVTAVISTPSVPQSSLTPGLKPRIRALGAGAHGGGGRSRAITQTTPLFAERTRVHGLGHRPFPQSWQQEQGRLQWGQSHDCCPHIMDGLQSSGRLSVRRLRWSRRVVDGPRAAAACG